MATRLWRNQHIRGLIVVEDADGYWFVVTGQGAAAWSGRKRWSRSIEGLEAVPEQEVLQLLLSIGYPTDT